MQLRLPDGVGIRTLPTGGARLATDGPEVTDPEGLWNRIAGAHRDWLTWGRPGWGRIGLTVHGRDQHVWLDHPGQPIGELSD